MRIPVFQSMIEKEFYIEGGNGISLYGKTWLPQKNIKAVLVIIHGLNDHISRYESMADFFCDENVALIGIDHPGHGKSSGKRGHISNLDVLKQNIHALLIESRKRYTDQPIFLYGHNFGGTIAINYASTHRSKELQGLIVSSPWIKPAFEPPEWKTRVAGLLGRMLPFITFPIDIDPMDLTRDPEKGREYLNDPLNHGRISGRLYNMIAKESAYAAEVITLLSYPSLFMHGEEDRLTSWQATAGLVEKAGNNAEFKLWKNLLHELHNEKDRDDVFIYMLDWIKNTNKTNVKYR